MFNISELKILSIYNCCCRNMLCADWLPHFLYRNSFKAEKLNALLNVKTTAQNPTPAAFNTIY